MQTAKCLQIESASGTEHGVSNNISKPIAISSKQSIEDSEIEDLQFNSDFTSILNSLSVISLVEDTKFYNEFGEIVSSLVEGSVRAENT